jgi:hypothetical protein
MAIFITGHFALFYTRSTMECLLNEICGLLGYYASSCGNCLPTFRDNVSVPSSRVKSPRTFEDGTETA